MSYLDITLNPSSMRIFFNARVSTIDDVCNEVKDFLLRRKVVKHFDVLLLLREALINAVVHGSKKDFSKQIKCDIWFEKLDLFIKVCDEGQGFDWRKKSSQIVELASTSGRGLSIMKVYATKMEYNECGNEVTLIKNVMMPAGVE